MEMALRMENGEVDLFSGSRRIAELRGGLEDEQLDDPDLTTFVAIDSEIDAYPTGESRSRWAADVLAEKDRQRAAYLERVRDEVLRACRALIRKWGEVA